MMKVMTQQHVLQNVNSKQTKQNPDYSKRKYSCHLEINSWCMRMKIMHFCIFALPIGA